jgi:hypothetical protein
VEIVVIFRLEVVKSDVDGCVELGATAPDAMAFTNFGHGSEGIAHRN